MMLLLQIALPVTLLVWLQFFPMTTWWALVLQLLAVGASLLGLAFAMPWIFPPWWFPYACMSAFLILSAIQIMRFRRRVALREGLHWHKGLPLLLVTMLGAYGGVLTVQSVMGRTPPRNVSVVNIASPFPAGLYLVAHGGSNLATNAHLKTLDPAVERFKRWRGQSYALDIVRIDQFGLRAIGYQPTDPSTYFTYGTPVLSPCHGSVSVVADGLADMEVPLVDAVNLPGNFIIIDCSEVFVVLAHLRKDSIIAKVGQAVTLGEKLGEMGNSGNSSEPHLHVHAQRDVPSDFPLGGEPLVLTIDGRYLVRNDRINTER